MLDAIITPSQRATQAEQRKKRTANLNRQLRYRLSDLWRDRHRGCSFISDDDEGRLMLMLLLRSGTTTESAMESARWVTDERELKALRKAGGKIPWQQIGELLKLTYAERMDHKLWQWMPIDVAPDEVRRRQAQRNTEKNRERQRKQRAKNKKLREMVSNNTDRRDAIIAILRGADARPRGIIPSTLLVLPYDWTHASALINRAQTVRAFWRPDGLPSKPASLRMLVHRTLKELEADGVIETKTVPGVRGKMLLVRLADPIVTANRGGHRDAFCYRNSVTAAAKLETVDGPTACTQKPASETPSRSVIETAATPPSRNKQRPQSRREQRQRTQRASAEKKDSSEGRFEIGEGSKPHRARSQAPKRTPRSTLACLPRTPRPRGQDRVNPVQ